MTSFHNAALMDNMRSEFVQSLTPTTAWGNQIAIGQMLLGLRGLWTFSAMNESNVVMDASFQARHVTPAGNPTYALYGLTPYTNLIAASSRYHFRADEAGLDFASVPLTLASWVWFEAASTGVISGIASKWNTLAAANQRSYRIYKDDRDSFRFGVSSNGVATTTVTLPGVYETGRWFFVAGRYTQSSEMAIFVGTADGTLHKNINTTAIPASIFGSTAMLGLGYTTDGGAEYYLTGRQSCSWMCAYAQPDYVIRAFFDHTRALYGAKISLRR